MRGQQPAGVPEAHLVGDENQDQAGQRSLAQPPDPLGETGAVGGASLAQDAQGAPAGKGHCGVQRQGPVPAEPEGMVQVGYRSGQPVDGSHPVQPFQQDALSPV